MVAGVIQRKDKEKRDFLDITALVRSIQRAENKPDCFRNDNAINCDQLECNWRAYCVEDHGHGHVKNRH